MNKNKKIFFLTIIIIIVFIYTFGFIYNRINLNQLGTSIVESSGNNSIENVNNIYDTGNTIAKISDLNKSTKPLDSNSGNTDSSNLELNYREIIKLNKHNLDNSNNDLTYMGYPRLKKLANSSEDYNYFLTFHNTTSKDSYNGKHIYYTRSKDLKNWDKPKKLFEGNDKYHYSSADSLVLNDGTIMVVAAKVAYNVYNYDATQFNTSGIYVRYYDNNEKEWSKEKQIYAGLIWEPSIMQLSSGEIQVFFTNVAPVAYRNGKVEINGKKFDKHANTSTQFQSSGVAMISSIDDGKTWTPNITGTTQTYASLNKNPYVAYRVAQQYVKTRQTNSVVDFTNIRAYNNKAKKFQPHFGIKYNNMLIKMTDQMPVAIELNNKKKVVMALETVKVYMDNQPGQTEKTTKPSHTISLAYSNAKTVKINGENKPKYWLDIHNRTKKSFTSEKDVYNNQGLDLTEVGPLDRVNDVVPRDHGGAAPYISQFPSGETLLYYAGSNYPNLIIGDENGIFSYENKFTPYKENAGEIIFGSTSQLSSHSVAILTAPKKSDPRHIAILPLYLNHTIDVKNENLSSTNDDALFIGSDSQAQATIRATYDNNNIYFTIDRLDNYLTDSDLIGLYINSNNLKYNGQKYDYLHFNFNHKKLGIVELVKGNTKISVKGLSHKAVTVNTSKNENGGYKVIITVPRKTFNLTGTTIKLCAVLNNVDSSGTTISDMMTNTDIGNTDTWIKLNLVKKTIGTVSYTETNNKVVAKVTFNNQNVTITNNNGNNSYTFSKNGEFTFKYRDATGSTGTIKATVNSIKSTNNNLKSLSLSSGVLSPIFNANTTHYTAIVNEPSVTINATKGDSYQTITGTGNMQLQYGTNTFKIEVTSQSGSKKTYTIVITRPKDNSSTNTQSSNNYLESLSVEPGIILFNKDILEYEISVDNAITKLNVNANPEDSKSKIDIDNPSLKIGNNTITITVTAENGLIRIYKVIVKRLEAHEEKSDNNNIKSLKVAGHNIEFKPDILEYDLTINDEKQLTIDIVLEDNNASYIIEGNQNLKNDSTIKIKTLSESGLEKEYIINIYVNNPKKINSKKIVTIVVIITVSTILGLIYLYYKTKNNRKS